MQPLVPPISLFFAVSPQHLSLVISDCCLDCLVRLQTPRYYCLIWVQPLPTHLVCLVGCHASSILLTASWLGCCLLWLGCYVQEHVWVLFKLSPFQALQVFKIDRKLASTKPCLTPYPLPTKGLYSAGGCFFFFLLSENVLVSFVLLPPCWHTHRTAFTPLRLFLKQL
jgi:hypothetical protein